MANSLALISPGQVAAIPPGLAKGGKEYLFLSWTSAVSDRLNDSDFRCDQRVVPTAQR